VHDGAIRGNLSRMDELVVPSELCRNAITDSDAVVDAAVWLINHMCEHIGFTDLGNADVLDFGCGVRFTQAFLNRGVPIKSYVGVDVSRDVTDFLRASVFDPRFEYVHLDAHNDRYNPTGKPLAGLTLPELEHRRFDLICLFSVFTHLAPDDYVAMLSLLRRFVRGDGWLFYTLFINERTEGGHGYADRMSRALGASDDPRVIEAIEAAINERGTTDAAPPDFIDADPCEPMLYAVYSRTHALDLIKGTGWKVHSVSPPDEHLQHHIVCAPET
jgi:SAM-dependent methyltransferase